MKSVPFPWFFLALTLAPGAAAAQNNAAVTTGFQNRFTAMAAMNKVTQLHLHTDKTVYTQGDYIWFTGYLLYAAAPREDYHTLYATLYSKDSAKPLLNGQFVMKSSACNGSLLLPDSLPPGDYMLAAHTNILSGRVAGDFFYQRIKVISRYKDPFTITFTSPGGKSNPDSAYISGYVNRQDGEPLTGLRLQYRLHGGTRLLHQGVTKVGESGVVSLALGGGLSAYPSLALTGRLTTDDYYVRFERLLKTDTAAVQLRLYPEGGGLIDGLPAVVAVEAMDAAGRPVAVTLSLTSNGEAVKQVTVNNTGFGKFSFTPRAGNTYALVAGKDAARPVDGKFPEIHVQGAALAVEDAVADTDTLLVDIFSKKRDMTAYLVLHDYLGIFYFARFDMNGYSALVGVPVKEIPAGMYALALLDQDGQVLSSRSIFLHFNKPPQISIQPDSAFYHTRSKINCGIQTVFSKKGQPAMLSIAMAQLRHTDTLAVKDILTAYYVEPVYKRMAGRPMNFILPFNRQLLGQALLTRLAAGNYALFEQRRPADTLLQRLGFNGYVLKRNGKPDKPAELTVMTSGGNISTIQTGADGRFMLEPEQLEANAGERVMAFVNSKNQEDYVIGLYDERAQLEAGPAIFNAEIQHGVSAAEAVLETQAAAGDPLFKTLPPVTVKAVRTSDGDRRDAFMKQVYKSKDCNDYVCLNNILNCQNHVRNGTPPVAGLTYTYYEKFSTTPVYVVYESCGDIKKKGEEMKQRFMHQLRARSYAYEFSAIDYSKDAAPLPELGATVYWNPAVQTGADGKATLNFYTNDLSGAFLLHVQGITDEGVFSKKMLLRVVK